MNFLNLAKRSPASRSTMMRGAIDYGSSKKNGGHDHRKNRGMDRTPAQKTGDVQSGKARSGS